MNPVYLKLKPKYQHLKHYRYLAYSQPKDQKINGIRFLKKPYTARNINDFLYYIISEEEFKMETI